MLSRRILSTDEQGREVKAGMVVPVQQTPMGEQRVPARYFASLETAATETWVTEQLARLAAGEAALVAAEWQTLRCRGEAAVVRDAQVTYFTNQAERMAYDQYRAAGWDIGSGMIESACTRLIGQRLKGRGCAGAMPARRPWPTYGC